MRAIHWRSVAVILVGAVAVGCGSDSTQPGNTAPVANFTSSCTDLDCTFTDLSSDPDGTVSSLSWDFGDAGSSSSALAAHSFTSAGTKTVTLTATDNDGDATSVSKDVTVSARVNGAPTAAFDIACSSLTCAFTDASTDADGTVVSWAWEFSDGATSTEQSPTRTFVATSLATYTAKLTVTDNAGLTSIKTTEFTVSPAATLQCEDASNPGAFASCKLTLLADAKVRVTLTSRECTAQGNAFEITAPTAAAGILFSNGCYAPAVGTSFDLNGGAVFAAGTDLDAQVTSGSTVQQVAPALRVEGSYPTWTLKFDDGEDNTPPEPDFNDLVITVTATPQ